MNKIILAIKALRAGVALTDSKNWKVKQNFINALIVLLGLVVPIGAAFGYSLELSYEDTVSIASGIAAIAGLFNIYTTTATTEKIGLSNVPNSGDASTTTTSTQPEYEPGKGFFE